jgi:hypothetical protein
MKFPETIKNPILKIIKNNLKILPSLKPLKITQFSTSHPKQITS